MTQGTICSRDVMVNPLNPALIYLFPVSVFVISWKTGERIFMKCL